MNMITRSIRFLLGLAFAAAMIPAAPALASLIGDDISIVFDFAASPPNTFSHPDIFFDGATPNPCCLNTIFPKPVVSGIFQEASAGYFGFLAGGQFTVDVDDSSIWVRMVGGTEDPRLQLPFIPGIDIVLADLDWVNDPSGIIQNVIAQQAGFLSVVNIGQHGVTLRIPGEILIQSPSFLFEEHFDIITSHGGQVPEPGTLAILGLGLAGLGLARRKRAA